MYSLVTEKSFEMLFSCTTWSLEFNGCGPTVQNNYALITNQKLFRIDTSINVFNLGDKSKCFD